MNKAKASHRQRYYNEYWQYRISQGRIHTKEDMWIPQRLRIAVRMLLTDLKAKNQKDARLLDLGCGEGTIGKLLKENCEDGFVLLGCDISRVALELARPHYSRIVAMDLEKDKFPEEFHTHRFDYVTMLDVLEHTFKPQRILAKCREILNQDGVLIASFPNIAWYRYRMDLLKGRFPSDYLYGTSDHIQQFTFPSFMDLLHESGFSSEAVDGQFVFPKVLRPGRVFARLCRKLPNLFGYQIVVKAGKATGRFSRSDAVHPSR